MTNETIVEELEPYVEDNDPLLLTSLDCFWSLIAPILDALQPATLCEIGIGDGDFTKRLIAYCKAHDANYTGIDPTVSNSFVSNNQSSSSTFICAPSLTALKTLGQQDVYFVDGDHNYYTVLNELKLCVAACTKAPLIILHDVSWPWSRRDQYCDPGSIPKEFRHNHTTKGGVMPGQNDVQEDGFKGEDSDYQYATATHEGGKQNGVLTAVEDFIAKHDEDNWKLVTIPAVFGMGILYRPNTLPKEAVSRLGTLETGLDSFSALIGVLEKNRLDLFLAFMKNLKHIDALSAQYKKLAEHADKLLNVWRGLRQYATDLECQIETLKTNKDSAPDQISTGNENNSGA
jgi:hypothetical protein